VITFIIGGSGSGKSAYAERMAAEAGGKIVYVATADASDIEMAARVALHKSRRPPSWDTWEGKAEALSGAARKLAELYDVLLLDSLTTYLSALFMSEPAAGDDDETAWSAAEKKILCNITEIFTGFKDAASDGHKRLIAVSDEVGCGVVPEYQSGRRFRGLQGRANQAAAALSDETAFIAAGLPLWLKTRDDGA
jgi:adenosylcobinamide kinase/adenosylcobinamide-phosphate guanylyltransferase